MRDSVPATDYYHAKNGDQQTDGLVLIWQIEDITRKSQVKATSTIETKKLKNGKTMMENIQNT